MNANYWGYIPATVEKVLREYGPMTSTEMLEFIHIDLNSLNKALRYMNQPSRRRKPLGVKRIYISGWTHNVEGGRLYPRKIWALGDEPDKRRPPKKKRSEIVKEQTRRKMARTRMNFVFNLGAPT